MIFPTQHYGFLRLSHSRCLRSLPCSSSLLHRLPATLLVDVCDCLSLQELLSTIARTAKTTRDLLTPACFSSHHLWSLDLGPREMLLLSSLPSPSPTVPSLHSRVLSECELYVDFSSPSASMQQLLDSLDHFPSNKTLKMSGG